MTCSLALIKVPISINSNMSLADATSLLHKNNIRCAPVLDESGKFLGLFSFHSLFTSLLPVAVRMEGGLDQLDFVGGSAPGIAKRLKKNSSNNILDHLDKEKPILTDETPMWEGVRVLVKFGSPIPITDKSGKFIGIITEQSCLAVLEGLQNEAAARPEGELSPEDIEILKQNGVI